MNSVTMIGRLASDVELRHTSSGKAVCSFRLAVNAGKDKEAYFFSCVAWNATAENLQKYFHKGSTIGISGILTTRSYETDEGQKRTVTEILVNSFDFCGDRQTTQAQTAPAEPTPDYVEPNSGDLPFQL